EQTTTTAEQTTTTAEQTTTTAEQTTTTAEQTTTTAEQTTTTAEQTTTTAEQTTTTQVGGQCPTSTVVIDGCDSRVPNQLSNGSCISDLIAAECPTNRHGKYVRCVAKDVTRELRRNGEITGREKGRIVSCAGKSDIGKPNN
ncbi:MAG: hypothetical protein WBN81_04255, partial [Gammaproteobacteria bacterium]